MADEKDYTKEPIPGRENAPQQLSEQGPGYTREPLSTASSSGYVKEPIQARSSTPDAASDARLSTGDIIKGAGSHIYHSFRDAPTPGEKAEYADYETQEGEAPGTETSGLKRVGLGVKRLTGADDSTARHFGSGAWEGLGNILSTAYGAGKDLIATKTPILLSDEPEDQGSISKRVQGNTLLNKYMFAPAKAEDEKARTAKSDLESIGHSVAGAIPFIGPVAAHLAERAGTGDVAGALGEGATYVAAPKVAEEVAPKVVKGIVRAKTRVPILLDLLDAIEKNNTKATSAEPAAPAQTPELVPERTATVKPRNGVGGAPQAATEQTVLPPEETPGNVKTLRVRGGKVVDTDPYDLRKLIEEGLKSDNPKVQKGLGQVEPKSSPLGSAVPGLERTLTETTQAVGPLVEEAKTTKQAPLQMFKEGTIEGSPKDWLSENPSESDAHSKLEAHVMDLPKSEFQAAATKAGVPLDSYDVRETTREGGSKHPTGRQVIARQIVQKLTPEAIENFLSAPEETTVASQDQSGLSRAERAKRLLKNLYTETNAKGSPTDQFGNPRVSGGSQGASALGTVGPPQSPLGRVGVSPSTYNRLFEEAVKAGPAWTPAKAEPIISELNKLEGNEFQVRGSVGEGRTTDNDLDVWQKKGTPSDAAATLKRLGFKRVGNTPHGETWTNGAQHIDIWDSAHEPKKGFGADRNR